MPDINASLKMATNGTGPQHKKQGVREFQWTEGSDNAMHVKVTDKEGNPIDPRDINIEFPNQPDDYPDSAALSELQAMKEDITTTNQKLDNVIDKLNGTLDTQLTGSNVVIKDVNADPLGAERNVQSGETFLVEIEPPEGVIWRTPLVWVRTRVPEKKGATTGNHKIELLHGINSYHYMVLRAESNYGAMCRIMSNTAETATESSLPSNEMVQQQAITGLILSKDYPLYISYKNSTDAENAVVDIRLIVTEERVSE